jgi:hypothetical protein
MFEDAFIKDANENVERVRRCDSDLHRTERLLTEQIGDTTLTNRCAHDEVRVQAQKEAYQKKTTATAEEH